MSTSLRDQLLKVGLINQKQAADAERHQQHHERQRDRDSSPKRRASRPPEARKPAPAQSQRAARPDAAPRRPQSPPSARPQADRLQADRLQAERKKAERKARFAEIKQLIEQNRLSVAGEATAERAGEAYHFVDGTKIKRITVDAAARAKIAAGEAVILRFDGRYELLSVAIAERVRERDERILLIKPTVAGPAPSDAAYEAFPVPDDLIW